jgi:hypothetical protein
MMIDWTENPAAPDHDIDLKQRTFPPISLGITCRY